MRVKNDTYALQSAKCNPNWCYILVKVYQLASYREHAKTWGRGY